MFCEGIFKFKEIRKVDKGSFKNDKGEVINYGDSYKLNVDELTEKGIKQRFFKVSTDNTTFINQIKSVKSYTDVKIKFKVDIYDTHVSLVPVSLV